MIFTLPADMLDFLMLLQKEAEAKRGIFVHGEVGGLLCTGASGGMYVD